MKKRTNKKLKTFENLSAIITGFSKADIIATGLLEVYFETIENELGKDVFESLLLDFEKIKLNDAEQLSKSEHSNLKELIFSSKHKIIINQIIQLWYLGEWITTSGSNQNYIISSQSYLEGLIWKAIAAHPMGGKQPGFGTWGFPPLTFQS